MSLYTDLKTRIKTDLTAITGIKNVYGYEKGDLNGFPSAVVTLDSLESTMDSTNSNERKYSFKVKVYQEMVDDAVGAEEAESRMDALIDSLIAKFETDWTIGDYAYNSAIKGIVGYVDRGNAMRVIEMTIEAYASVNIS
jgi:hypothetical protein